ncbi:ImmA/IrrE family metallo-endopeptidase [Cryobacterium fucosi]|uniref:ImmA/IrrE family metallo-endopeptidase n=1 Tax=Cryobacterium fucosi TaxID=1259157 RepID=A0A4R9BCP1_9MICO|nr:ImmA/IrrE family metallo-endopeptidase [Cryobacterium fucosi]TFD79280.1 ImmA/IrrE family metallo-endopeptidase [Cryobacterium fucosi]
MNIEQTVSTAVASLALGNVFTFDDLVRAVQDRRQRTLRVVELADLGDHDGICAVWLITESEDLVLHAHSDSVLHRQQFVLHEFAHMLLGHGQGDECSVEDVLLPDIPAHTRGRLLARQDLDSDREIAAESVADRLAASIRGSALAESRYLEIFG